MLFRDTEKPAVRRAFFSPSLKERGRGRLAVAKKNRQRELPGFSHHAGRETALPVARLRH
jgi:hypothetical protein